MKYPILFLISLLLLGFSTGLCSPTWPNEPASSTVLLDHPFNGDFSPFYYGGGGTIVNDATAPVSAPNVLKSTLQAGQATGGSDLHWSSPRLLKEMYVGMMWRNNTQFNCLSIADKMWFMQGPLTHGFFGLDCGPGDKSGRIGFGHNSQGLDNSHTCSADLGLVCNPNIASVPITHGTWTKLESYIKTSTSATSRDGIVRWWVNGVLVGNYTNMNYPGGLNEWFWTETWAGLAPEYRPTVEMSHFLDHLHISEPHNAPPPVYLIITTTLNTARTGTPYTATLAADGGTKPYTWFRESGNLPNGLTLNQSTGVISGTPTCVGRSDFTIRVTDGSQPALTATKSYTIITSGTGTCASGMENSRETGVWGYGFESGKLKIESKTGSARFQLSGQEKYSLNVYDLTGREVWRHAGSGEAVWNHGKKLKKGVYLVRVEQAGKTTFANYCNLR